MKYLLDTDHLSILQRKTGKDYDNLITRMIRHSVSDFVVSTINTIAVIQTTKTQTQRYYLQNNKVVKT